MPDNLKRVTGSKLGSGHDGKTSLAGLSAGWSLEGDTIWHSHALSRFLVCCYCIPFAPGIDLPYQTATDWKQSLFSSYYFSSLGSFCLSCSPCVFFFPSGTGIQPCLFFPLSESLCSPLGERLVRLLMGLFCQEKQSLCGIVSKKKKKLMKKNSILPLKISLGIISQCKFILFLKNIKCGK